MTRRNTTPSSYPHASTSASLTLGVFVLFVLFNGAICQFISSPAPGVLTTVSSTANTTVRYKHVTTGPGSICELDASVTSLSGYVDVSVDRHLFFWFFSARKQDPHDAALTVWVSGGPGDSSMSELFTEHGPCRINHATQEIYSNYFSWNNYSNVVYIDQPVSVGFSYVDPLINGYVDQDSCNVEPITGECPKKLLNSINNNCAQYGLGICGTFSEQNVSIVPNSTESAAPDFYVALQGFIGAFPEYASKGVNFASESYGGHYVPVYSRYMLEQNTEGVADRTQITLKSVLVGNGWFDPAIGYTAHYNFTFNPGNTYDVQINSEAAHQSMQHALTGPGQCLDQLAQCNYPTNSSLSTHELDEICKKGDDYCTSAVQNVYENQMGRDEYDVRELNPDPFIYLDYENYLGYADVVKELGVRVNYTDASNIIGQAFENTGDDGRELGIIDALRSFLRSNISVTLYHGDADYTCNWYGGETVADRVAQDLSISNVDYGTEWPTAGFVDIETSDGVVRGQVKQVARLAFVRVYEAGHATGFYQPLLQQTIFQRTISFKDIQTGIIDIAEGSVYKTTGSAKSTYTEGRSTVQNHTLPDSAIYTPNSDGPNTATNQNSTGTTPNAALSFKQSHGIELALILAVICSSVLIA